MSNEAQMGGINRRALLATSVSVAALQAVGTPHAGAQTLAPEGARGNVQLAQGSAPANLLLDVNGQPYRVSVDQRASLLDVLRESIGLTGTKKGCDHGQCGACTVHIDGAPKLSCLTLAVLSEGHRIETIEGLARGNGLHPVQRAFIDHDAFQCGYCTPGQIMAAIGCINEGHAHSDASIREYMSGNLCRCAAYPNIVAAIKDAAGKMERS